MESKWKEITLGEFVTFQRGHDLPESQRHYGNVPILGSFGITGWHDKAKVKGPGLTVGRSGASFGEVSYSQVDYWPLNTSLYVIDFHGNDEKFAYYFLKNMDFKRFNTGSAQPSLNRNHIHPIPVKIPPLAEQKHIAHILGTLDDKIELNRQMNQTLEGMARAIFKRWFVDFDPVRAKAEGRAVNLPKEIADLFPAQFEDSPLGKIPKGWKVGKIEDCCQNIQNGGTPRRSEAQYWNPPEIPWLTSGEVRQDIVIKTENFISKVGYENCSAKLWDKGTTVVALYGATAGQVCLLTKQMCSNQACCGLIPLKNMDFFNYLKVSSSVHIYEQQTRGSAQQNLSKQIVSELVTVVPSKAICDKFSQLVEPIFEKWISNQEENILLDNLRNLILPKLLSKKINQKVF